MKKLSLRGHCYFLAHGRVRRRIHTRWFLKPKLFYSLHASSPLNRELLSFTYGRATHNNTPSSCCQFPMRNQRLAPRRPATSIGIETPCTRAKLHSAPASHRGGKAEGPAYSPLTHLPSRKKRMQKTVGSESPSHLPLPSDVGWAEGAEASASRDRFTCAALC